jgi:hypothetical protein
MMLVPGNTLADDLPIRELTEKPHRFTEQTVTVKGRLKFIGRNYFSDPTPQFVVEDGENHQVPVAPWLPLEIVPSPPDRSFPLDRRPKVMSDYLGKELRVTGKFRLKQHRVKHEVEPEWVEELPSQEPREQEGRR